MKTKHGLKFSHDDEADDYDADVVDESRFFREGYADLLQWSADQINAQGCQTVLDIGMGTGNLTLKCHGAKIVGVDISEKMLAIAKTKLKNRSGIHYVAADLLEFFDQNNEMFDGAMSTYAIHHLEPAEKALLFQAIYNCLRPEGVAVFGDLMFENKNCGKSLFDKYRKAGQTDLVDEAEGEFYWNIEKETKALSACGFTLSIKQFSEFSWGILACKK